MIAPARCTRTTSATVSGTGERFSTSTTTAESAPTVAAYAVCAAPPPGLAYRFADSAVDSNDKSASVQCPFGTKVYGVGGYLSYLNGQTHFDRMVPHGSQWDGADVEAREDQDGFANTWFTEVEAVCGQ